MCVSGWGCLEAGNGWMWARCLERDNTCEIGVSMKVNGVSEASEWN